MRKFLMIAVTTMAAFFNTSCSQDDSPGTVPSLGNNIVARMAPAAQTRTAIGGVVDGTQAVGIMWTDGDEIGVFNATGDSQKRYAKVEAGNRNIASFAAAGTEAFAEPVYAYYPYSAVNDGQSVSSLSGTLPSIQEMDSGTLHGDYKYGRANGSSAQGHEFVFAHLFSMGRVHIDAEGTPLKGETLKSLTVTVTRGTAGKVAIAGNFVFDATNGNWSQNGEGTNTVTMEWKNGIALNQEVTGYISLFPNIAAGDLFTIEAKTENHRATFTATSQATFSREQIYNFPVVLNKYETIMVYDAEGNLVQNGPSDMETVTGTFTCATLNVDGLPSLVNSDGPGADGTTDIGKAVNNLGWAFMAVSEDFEYHSQLAAAMTNYNAGNYRGSVDISQAFGKVADTDGLGFFWKKEGIGIAGGTEVQYNDAEGNLYNGANTCIKKGFRHYEVTVADGVTVDVYITHMNTYSGSGNTEDNAYVKAQLAQLCQLRDYVVGKAKANKRPAIIMGDTNMRYTRHNILSNFIDPVTAEGFTVADPWVEFHRGGMYPAWNSKSLMIRSKFAGDTENDICCSDDQRGEVVDKIWYINVPGSAVRLKAKSCKNEVDNFIKSTENASYSGVTIEDADGNILTNQSVDYTKYIGLGDHFPVVVTFEYTYKYR